MWEQIYISIIIAGFGGGVVRGLVGFIKQFSFNKPQFQTLYFFTMMFLSGIVGLLTAIVVKEAGIDFDGLKEFSPAIAFIVGYAGGDLIENIYKIILKKPSLYEMSAIIQK